MLTGSFLRLPAIKVMNMEQSRCNADAKHIRHFLDICDGNWHSCIYVRCVSCKTPGYCNGPHFLYHPDENGSPCILPMADARMLFSRIPEPTECLSAITLEQFQSLYGLYFAKEALTDKPCPCFALLRGEPEPLFTERVHEVATDQLLRERPHRIGVEQRREQPVERFIVTKNQHRIQKRVS